MSSNNEDDRPEWAAPPREDPQTDDSVVTQDTAAPTKRYDCPYCDKTFVGDSAIEKRSEHISKTHPDEVSSENTDDSESSSDGALRSTVSGLAGFVGGLSDEETGSYRGLFSTPAERGAFLFASGLGSLLAHGVVSVEFLAALGGLGLAGAGLAARKDEKDTRDGIQRNIEHYVLGILFGFLVVFLPHELIPSGWRVSDLFNLFEQYV